MKADDDDYSAWVALTKIATKEDPIKTKFQLDKALAQIKATTALTSRINARTSAKRLEVQAQLAQLEAQRIQLTLLEAKSKLNK